MLHKHFDRLDMITIKHAIDLYTGCCVCNTACALLMRIYIYYSFIPFRKELWPHQIASFQDLILIVYTAFISLELRQSKCKIRGFNHMSFHHKKWVCSLGNIVKKVVRLPTHWNREERLFTPQYRLYIGVNCFDLIMKRRAFWARITQCDRLPKLLFAMPKSRRKNFVF